MKASVKVREGQRPLVRAKVPINFYGLPLFSGISVGDQQELALHLGSYLEAGPSCRLSYKPNDVHSPFAVLLKTGFGLWGSPHSAPLTIAAEFNLARRENLSFTLRLKPRLGNFSFRKHFLSSNTRNISRIDSRQLDVALEEEEVSSERAGGVSPLQIESGVTTIHENGGHGDGLSPLGLGQGSGLKPREIESCYLGGCSSNGGFLHSGDGGPAIEAVGVHDRTAGSMEILQHHQLNTGDITSADMIESSELEVACVPNPHTEPRAGGWLAGLDQRSWRLSVHSAIPLGRQAIGRVQWGMRAPSDVFQNSGNREGSRCYGMKLPVLVLDKISISSIEPHRKLQYRRFRLETGPLTYGEESMDDSSQLGLIASMCCTMRNQLHGLHADSRSLKKVIEDLKVDLSQYGIWSGKRIPPKPQPLQEEKSIRSQLFDELQKKANERNSQKDRSSNPSYHGENKDVGAVQNEETVFPGLPIEDHMTDKLPVEPRTKARGSS